LGKTLETRVQEELNTPPDNSSGLSKANAHGEPIQWLENAIYEEKKLFHEKGTERAKDAGVADED